MPQCSQCEKPAVVNLSGHCLCVEHYHMFQETIQAQYRMLAAHLNYTTEQIEAHTGILGLFPKYQIPALPAKPSLTNINVTGGNVGVINTGAIHNLDSRISVMRERGNDDAARAIEDLANAVISSQEVANAAKDEILEHLDYLAEQVVSDAEHRRTGVIRSVLAKIRDSVSVAADLATLWSVVGPLLSRTLGV